MVTIIRREVRRRGIIGWICVGLFLAFNALMLFVLLRYLFGAVPRVEAMRDGPGSDGAKAAVVTITLVTLGVWGFGDLVLGMFVLMTRGRVTVVEQHHGTSGGERREPTF